MVGIVKIILYGRFSWSFCRTFAFAQHSVTLQSYGHSAERSVLPNIQLLYNHMVILPKVWFCRACRFFCDGGRMVILPNVRFCQNILLLYNCMVILPNVRFCRTFGYFTIVWSFCHLTSGLLYLSKLKTAM